MIRKKTLSVGNANVYDETNYFTFHIALMLACTRRNRFKGNITEVFQIDSTICICLASINHFMEINLFFISIPYL